MGEKKKGGGATGREVDWQLLWRRGTLGDVQKSKLQSQILASTNVLWCVFACAPVASSRRTFASRKGDSFLDCRRLAVGGQTAVQGCARKRVKGRAPATARGVRAVAVRPPTWHDDGLRSSVLDQRLLAFGKCDGISSPVPRVLVSPLAMLRVRQQRRMPIVPLNHRLS